MDSAQEFFFVDGAGSQCGPVTAATLKEYWAGGYVNDTTYAFAVDGSTANRPPSPPDPLESRASRRRSGGPYRSAPTRWTATAA